MAVRCQIYPRSLMPPPVALDIAQVFIAAEPLIGTDRNQPPSTEVLGIVRPGLLAVGFEVERPGLLGTLKVPVLFGINGRPTKWIEVDAWREDIGAVVEVEAGTAYDARSFYKDLFQAAAMPRARFLCIAVMNAYHPPRRSRPFDGFARVGNVLDTLFASAAFTLDIDAVMLLGY